MATIINPRGASGSGKTELVRRLLADYGWSGTGQIQLLAGPAGDRPIGYQLEHPSGRTPLTVIGHYERTSGGCDTIRSTDGGLDEIYRLADSWASVGHDVVLEGAAWSVEYTRSAALGARHKLHVLRLSTSLEHCARNLIARRRLGRQAYPSLKKTLLAQQLSIEAACLSLETIATVEYCDFQGALQRARALLAIPERHAVPASSEAQV